MRNLLGPTLRLGVSAAAVSLLAASRWRPDDVKVLAEQPLATPGIAAVGAALHALLEGQDVANRAVSVVLADELCRLWQVVPPPQAARLADIEAAAALRFHALYGEAPGAWQLTADWHAKEPFFAAAVPRVLLAAIGQVANDARLHVVQVVPHFVTAWNRWCRAIRPGAWFGQLHDNLLTVAAIDGGRLCAVRALQVPHGADHYWLTQMLQREALLLGLALPERLQLCGAVPAALQKGAGEGQVPVLRLDAGQGDALSAASRLAFAGSTP
ncbi:hypothetical protein IP92_00806 [Pseudoduganella flava]|uniref:Uncharacterized protein n=1 Tax=Pseudoduganella flava TaxID=871742 RepID=A0A562Q4Y6_9BURK|nr:hypothetical protein [Pseudoduganella flava]QGZ41809.1 hypothetical protein GO485_23960 [Pseudoduganella flava]TWI51817.1 hypothetical protein IP92_00806 [Pseudoduganella flava]